MSYAEIKKINNSNCVFVDGEPLPPMMMTMYGMDQPDYIKSLRESGIRIFFVFANTDWMRPGRTYTDENGNTAYEPSGFEAFDLEISKLLAAAPDAYVIVRIGMHPPVEWVENHPDDVVTFSDGKPRPTTIVSEIHKDTFPGHYSMASENWRNDASSALNDFCDKLDKKDYKDRIIGFFFGAGGTSEWYYTYEITYMAEKVAADHSPAFRAVYTEFLKNKYGTVENLRKAWKKPDATFENPIIPTFEERSYFKTDEIALSKVSGESIYIDDKNENEPDRYGVLLNANDYMYVADFFNALHYGSAKSVVRFASEIKKRYEGMLTGAFYGSLGNTNVFCTGTAAGTLLILNSGKLDFLAAPGVYRNRQPGGFVGQREMNDSFKIRNMMFVSEEDSRTHRDRSPQRDSSDLYTLRDTIVTLKRDFARNICEETHGWWFDQTPGGNRYKEEGIYELFSAQQEIADAACRLGEGKKNEIAIICNIESVHYASLHTNAILLDYYRCTDLGRLGTGLDYYFDEDLDKAEVPDYKVYIMLNTIRLTDEARERIKKKAAKNGAMIIWLYADGFVNPDSETVATTENMKDIVGMNVKKVDGAHYSKFRLTEPLHEAVKYGDLYKQYGFIDRNIRYIVTYKNEEILPFTNPLFYIDDEDAIVLGRYSIDGKPALAMKQDENGITNVYCGAHTLRSELLISLAEYAGCHIYGYDDDCIYASEDFVTVHAKEKGKHTIHFKKPCNPFEVYERKYYGKNVTSLEVDMQTGDTLMFTVNDKIAEKLSK